MVHDDGVGPVVVRARGLEAEEGMGWGEARGDGVAAAEASSKAGGARGGYHTAAW
ncbi:MAG: hypothetical protein RL033_7085 [Pseudomonadota bacterium]|jgi:hypothetical protein